MGARIASECSVHTIPERSSDRAVGATWGSRTVCAHGCAAREVARARRVSPLQRRAGRIVRPPANVGVAGVAEASTRPGTSTAANCSSSHVPAAASRSISSLGRTSTATPCCSSPTMGSTSGVRFRTRRPSGHSAASTASRCMTLLGRAIHGVSATTTVGCGRSASASRTCRHGRVHRLRTSRHRRTATARRGRVSSAARRRTTNRRRRPHRPHRDRVAATAGDCCTAARPTRLLAADPAPTPRRPRVDVRPGRTRRCRPC